MIVILLHLVCKDVDFVFRHFRGVSRSDVHIWVPNEEQFYKFLKEFGHDINLHIGGGTKMFAFYDRHFHLSTKQHAYIITDI